MGAEITNKALKAKSIRPVGDAAYRVFAKTDSSGGMAESPYDPEFVAKIRRSEKQLSVKVDLEDLWK
jgi:hypothetical protein